MSTAEELAQRLRFFAELPTGLGDLLEPALMDTIGVQDETRGKEQDYADQRERHPRRPPSQPDERGPIERKKG
jgi:hypothetical protein